MSPGAGAERRRIAFLVTDYWGSGWYRCYVPGFALERLGYEVSFYRDTFPVDLDKVDVLVVQVPSSDPRLKIMKAARHRGIFTVAEFDDDVWNVAPTNSTYRRWNAPGVLEVTSDCVAVADLVTAPGHSLATTLSRMNPNVKVLPNMLPPDDWDLAPREPKPDGTVTLGWAGGNSHAGDLALVADVVAQLLERYPNLEVAIAGGPDTPEIAEHERVRTIEPTDIEGYPQILAQFDVGMIPLADTVFNRAKSDLKFVEYSMAWVPSVVSKVEPYLRSVKHGENGFFATSPKDWLRHLSRLIEDATLRAEMASAAHEFALGRGIDPAIGRWEKAYGLTRP